jgi:hypothetical protein
VQSVQLPIDVHSRCVGDGPRGSGSQRAYRGDPKLGSANPATPVCNLHVHSALHIGQANTCDVDEKRLVLPRRPVRRTMIKTNQRRTSKRMEMELPVEIRWTSRAGSQKLAKGKTWNISGSGLFIEIPVRLHRATSVKIKVLLPKEVTQVPLELLCQGRVVRWNQQGQVQGLGAVIDEYELRPVAQTPSGGKRSATSG